MDIEGRIRELGSVDSNALASAILDLDESAWLENSHRQRAYKEHRDTESVVLVFTNSEAWPELRVEKQQGWDHLIDVAGPLMHEIIREHYSPGGTIVRAMAAKLKAGGKIRPHVDAHPSFSIGHRIHVPITTNPRVRFMYDGNSTSRPSTGCILRLAAPASPISISGVPNSRPPPYESDSDRALGICT